MDRHFLQMFLTCGLCFLASCGGTGSGRTGSEGRQIQPIAITSGTPPSGTAQTPYGNKGAGFSFAASGGIAPFGWNWAASTGSSLPPGLELSSSGLISGTPTTAGSFNVTVTVSDSESPAAQKSAIYPITIATQADALTIASGNPPNGTVGQTYNGHLVSCSPGSAGCRCEYGQCFRYVQGFHASATGGVSPYTWNWTPAPGSSLPPGLAFSSGGFLSGTPTAVATFNVILEVTDSTSNQVSRECAIVINDAPPALAITTTLPAAGGINLPYNFAFAATGGTAPYSWDEKGALSSGMTLSNAGLLSGTPTEIGVFSVTLQARDTFGESATQSFTIQICPHGFGPAVGMKAARQSHTATLLNDGRVLVTGGSDPSGASLATAELFDPATGSSTPTGSMAAARVLHTATLLNDGRVLIIGGHDSTGNAITSAESFNPASGSFSPAGVLVTARFSHTATLLKDGMVLVTGGTNGLASAELFNPTTGTFSPTGNMITGRTLHAASLLGDGTVLVTGGLDDYNHSLATAEIFNPSTGTFAATGSMEASRVLHSATLLNDGKVLFAGGTQAVTTAELFDPGTGVFTPTGSMEVTRFAHTATLLSDGTVLVVGGSPDAANDALTAAELFNPSTGTFTATGSLMAPRVYHTATLLVDGKVLVTGGVNLTAILETAEFYQ